MKPRRNKSHGADVIPLHPPKKITDNEILDLLLLLSSSQLADVRNILVVEVRKLLLDTPLLKGRAIPILVEAFRVYLRALPGTSYHDFNHKSLQKIMEDDE